MTPLTSGKKLLVHSCAGACHLQGQKSSDLIAGDPFGHFTKNGKDIVSNYLSE
jgi:hypothetical protein